MPGIETRKSALDYRFALAPITKAERIDLLLKQYENLRMDLLLMLDDVNEKSEFLVHLIRIRKK